MATAHVPARLSPLHAIHAKACATFVEVAGWQVIQSYGDAESELQAVSASAGVCDISGRSATRIKSLHLDDVLGDRSPAIGSILRADDSAIARLTTEEALAIGPPSAVGGWQAGIESKGVPRRHVVDITSGLAALRIAGPRAQEVMASLTDLDLRDSALPDGSCAQAGFAGVHGTLLRLNIANAAAFELYIAREFGVYVWDVVVESLGHGAVVPFGNEALQRLEQGR